MYGKVKKWKLFLKDVKQTNRSIVEAQQNVTPRY